MPRVWPIAPLLLLACASSPAPCDSLAAQGAALAADGSCVVPGDLLLDGKQSSLPARLRVTGSLRIKGTEITGLPEGLFVGGDLYLHKTGIARLPEGLTVEGNFDADGGWGSEYIYCDQIPASVTIKGRNNGCLARWGDSKREAPAPLGTGAPPHPMLRAWRSRSRWCARPSWWSSPSWCWSWS